VKKLFAVLAVFALAAVGCDDKKTSAKPGDKGTVVVQTNKAEQTVHTDVTHTKIVGTETVHKTDTRVHTVEVPNTKTEKGPTPPAGGGDKPKGDGK
jgi:hypothetical protein